MVSFLASFVYSSNSFLVHPGEVDDSTRSYSSAIKAVQVEFPEMSWHSWKFTQSPKNWWPEVAEKARAGDPLALTAARLYTEEANLAISATEHQRLRHFGGISELQSLLNGQSSNANRKTGVLTRTNNLGEDEMSLISRLVNATDLTHGSYETLTHISANDILNQGGMYYFAILCKSPC